MIAASTTSDKISEDLEAAAVLSGTFARGTLGSVLDLRPNLQILSRAPRIAIGGRCAGCVGGEGFCIEQDELRDAHSLWLNSLSSRVASKNRYRAYH